MKLQSIIFMSFFYLTLLFNIKPTILTSLNNNVNDNLLESIIISIHKSLSYLKDVEKYLTIDALLGVKVVADQTNVLLKYLNCSNGNDRIGRFNHIETCLNELNQQANELMHRSLPPVFLRAPLYFQSVGRLLSSRLWSSIQSKPYYIEKEEKHLFKTIHIQSDHFNLNESLADFCLGEVLNECKISNFCSLLLIKQNYVGYRRAHQALYLIVAKMMNCFNGMPSNDLETIDQRIANLCQSMFINNLQIERNNYPNEDQDLFMENIFICGYHGFTSFREKNDWLRAILKWQHQTKGCFPIDRFKLLHYLSSGGRPIIKRRETIFTDGCSLHKTSMALATIIVYFQHMIIKQIMPNASNSHCIH